MAIDLSNLPFDSRDKNQWQDIARKLRDGEGVPPEKIDRGITQTAKLADTETLATLLKYGNPSQRTLLMAMRNAVGFNKPDSVKTLLDAGVDVDIGGGTPLRIAAGHMHSDRMLLLLLERGADVHINGDDALLGAIEQNRKSAVELLLKHGADANAGDGAPLLIATENNNQRIVRMLLAHGADPGARDGEALKLAKRKDNDAISDMLDTAIAAREKSDGEQELFKAASKRDWNAVRRMAGDGVDITHCDDWALREAAQSGNLDMVKFLHQRGGDIHAGNDEPIRWAMSEGRRDVVSYLLEKGCDMQTGADWAVPILKSRDNIAMLSWLRDRGMPEDALGPAGEREKWQGRIDVYKSRLRQRTIENLRRKSTGKPKLGR